MKEQEYIDKYLNGEMSATEREAFEASIQQDFILRTRVRLHRELRRFFENRNTPLENQLTELGNKYFQPEAPAPKRRFSWYWAVLALAGIALVFFLIKNLSNQAVKEPPRQEQVLPPEPAAEETPGNKVQKMPVEEVPRETKEELPSKADKPATPAESPARTEPAPSKKQERNVAIAEANPDRLVKNPLLEMLRTDQLRSEEIELALPNIDIEYAWEEEINLVVKGTTKARPPFKLKLYSNNQRDFEEDVALLDVAIPAKKQPDGAYRFEIQKRLPLERGLYYMIILRGEDEEVLKVLRAWVR